MLSIFAIVRSSINDFFWYKVVLLSLFALCDMYFIIASVKDEIKELDNYAQYVGELADVVVNDKPSKMECVKENDKINNN